MTDDQAAVVLAEATDRLCYNPETGVFTWTKPLALWVTAGSEAGYQGIKYRYINFGKMQHLAHRLAWLVSYGHWPKGQIDHVNGDKRDNRLCNLREATATQNRANQKMRKDNTFGLKGARAVNGPRGIRYAAKITCNKVTYNLGTFPTLEDAHSAYAEKARQLFGDFARLG